MGIESTNYLCPKKKTPQKEEEKTGTGIFIMSSSVFGGTSTTRFRDLVKELGRTMGRGRWSVSTALPNVLMK